MLEYKWYEAGVKDPAWINVRTEVFVEEQGYPVELEFDDYDDTMPHLVIFSDGEAVATGRPIPVDEDTAKIGRIAVLKKMRGTGLGEKVVMELLRYVREQGAKTVLLSAQTYAVGFYEKCGFKLVGTPEYMDEHIPHRDMIQTF